VWDGWINSLLFVSLSELWYCRHEIRPNSWNISKWNDRSLLLYIITSACCFSVCCAGVRFIAVVVPLWMMASHVLGRPVRTTCTFCVLFDQHVKERVRTCFACICSFVTLANVNYWTLYTYFLLSSVCVTLVIVTVFIVGKNL